MAFGIRVSKQVNPPAQRFLMFGYFGGWNSGDEAILRSLRLNLEERCRAIKSPAAFAMVCTRVKREFQSVYSHQGIDFIESREWTRILLTLRTHRLIVGGGQMITGDRAYKGLGFLYALTLISRCYGNRPVIVGTGVEGVERRFAKWLCRRIVNNCEVVHCRDSYSLEMLKNAGCNSSKLSLTADVVLSGAIADEQASDETSSREPTNHQQPPIVVGLHHSPIREYFGREAIISLINTILERRPAERVLVVSNDSRQRFDASLLDEIRSTIKSDNLEFLHFDNVGKTIDAYATAKCVVSVRMHPLILALIHKVPVVGIACSNKVVALAERVGFPLFYPESQDIGEVLKLIDIAIKKDANDIDGLKMLSRMNFDFIK